MHKKKEFYEYEPGKESELYGYYEIDKGERSGFINILKRHFMVIILSLLMVAFIVLVVLPEVMVTIHAGERGVLYKRVLGSGVDLEHSYDEGLHFVLPWNILTPYNIRVQEEFDSMTVLTRKGMEVKLELSIRYHPNKDNLPYLHEEVGPDYAKTVVIPEVKGIVLSIFGNKSIENIYKNIYDLIKDANSKAKVDLIDKNIIIDKLVVKSISLPKTVRDSINEKIRYRQIALGYEYRIDAAIQEATRKKEEAKGIKSFQAIVSEGISENYLKWKGIDATLKLAESENSKVVVIGSAKDGLPLILNAETQPSVSKQSKTDLESKNVKD